MPTARPNVVTMFRTKVCMGKNWPMRPARASARTMLMMLSTSGRNAASTAPKTTTSTTSASGTPKSSALSMSLLASSLPIRFRLAVPVC